MGKVNFIVGMNHLIDEMLERWSEKFISVYYWHQNSKLEKKAMGRNEFHSWCGSHYGQIVNTFQK